MSTSGSAGEQRARRVAVDDVHGDALEARVRLLGPQLGDDRVDALGERPLTYVTAPHSASRAAIARPMPWVDPLTNALFPSRSILIARLSGVRGLVLGRRSMTWAP